MNDCTHPGEARRTVVRTTETSIEVCSACETPLAISPPATAGADPLRLNWPRVLAIMEQHRGASPFHTTIDNGCDDECLPDLARLALIGVEVKS